MLPNWISELELKELDIGEENGHTGYIDFISLDRMTFPAMKGIDASGRDFVAVKFLLEFYNNREGFCAKLKRFIFGNPKEQRFQTFFKRYTDNDNIFMGCGHGGQNLMDTVGGMTKEQIAFVQRVLQEDVSLTREETLPVGFMNMFDIPYTRCVVSLDYS